MRPTRFHGRHENSARACMHPGCSARGEFRAPGIRASSFDGPGEWRWFCLDHVRAFNAGFDWFAGMSAEEIYAAQAPGAGWRTESPSFRGAGAGDLPRWADYDDPLDAIAARAAGIKERAGRAADTAANGRFSRDEAEALATLGLSVDADRGGLRRRYTELLRRFHPDRNGGDRRHEDKLGQVVAAYQLLRQSSAFG
jgi:hypothetical protein